MVNLIQRVLEAKMGPTAPFNPSYILICETHDNHCVFAYLKMILHSNAVILTPLFLLVLSRFLLTITTP